MPSPDKPNLDTYIIVRCTSEFKAHVQRAAEYGADADSGLATPSGWIRKVLRRYADQEIAEFLKATAKRKGVKKK